MAFTIDLSGRVALITGAYRGLGFAIARGLAQAGARTVLNGRNEVEIDRAVATLEAEGGSASAATFDVTNDAAMRAGVAAIEARHGKIDVLVNNAGIQRRNALTAFTAADWDDIVAVNLTAPFMLAQAVLPGMIARKAGKIINIASLMSELSRPTIVPYTATKGGIRQMTRGMAVELAPHNIQVNAIAPGFFSTEMNRALIDNPDFNAWVKTRTPAGRWGEPDELAGVAVLLASDLCPYLTGQMIVVDGGMSVSL